MPAYRLIIFDFDGTLADSAAWLIAAYNGIATDFGLRKVDDAEVRMLRGRSSRDILTYLKVPVWKLPRIAAELRRLASVEAERIRLFDGVGELLHTLKQRSKQTAIVSSNSEDTVHRVLGPALVGCVDQFECNASMFGKAHKLRAVMKRTATLPAATLCIGDETRDIEAARDVGADSGAVLWGYANATILAQCKPTLQFNEVADIARLVS